MTLTKKELAAYMDHTLLKPEATQEQIDKVCKEAKELGCASVCVNGCWANHVAGRLAGTTINTCVVIGFPLGAMSTEAKVAETKIAVADGANEIDMVINIGALKDGQVEFVESQIAACAEAAHAGGAILKVIIECCLLTDDEKRVASRITRDAGADFVKTSTGFSTSGATVHDVDLMRDEVGPNFGVKAAGGIRTLKDALAMIEAGATRLGVSAAPQILAELDN